MVKIKSLFISDTHFGVKHNNCEILLEVLNTYDPENIFLVGDIIDFIAIEKKIRWNKNYGKIIKKIVSLSEKCNIVWVIGNHEFFLKQFIPFKIGNIKVLDEYIYKDYLIIHGDKFDSLIYKRQWLYWLGDFGYNIIIFLDYFLGYNGNLSKTTKKRVKGLSTYLNDFHKTAINYAKSKNCNSVICGHLHHQEFIKIENFNYYNCGNFREDKDFVIENLDGSIELISL